MVLETDNLCKISTYAKSCGVCPNCVIKWASAGLVQIIKIDGVKFIDSSNKKNKQKKIEIMIVEIKDKYGEVVMFQVDKLIKEYYVLLEGGKIVSATNNVPFLIHLDLIKCPTELVEFETKLGISWNAENEMIVV